MTQGSGPRWDDDTMYDGGRSGGGYPGGGAQWGPPPTSEFAPVAPPAYGTTPPRRGMSAGLAVLLTLMAVTIVGLIAAVAFFVVPSLTGSSAGPTTSTVVATATAPTAPADPGAQVAPAAPAQPGRAAKPSGAYECSDSGRGAYSRSAVGSSVTSCDFAVSVRSSYLGAGGNGGPMVVTAYSPVTGISYTMSCTGGTVVTCSGGNNAVVHIY